MEAAKKIASALTSGPLDGAQIQKLTGLWTIELYPTLVRMEQSGALEGDWVDGDYPRRRVYWAARSWPDETATSPPSASSARSASSPMRRSS